MNLEINVSPEVEAALKRQALAAGQDLATFVSAIVSEQVAGEPQKRRRSVDELMKKLDEIASRHPPSNGRVDYSRESIYD